MATSLSFGVTLPQIKRSFREARDAAQTFDRLGFDSVWVCDHMYGVPMPQIPILEAWSLLAAVAPLTERVKLGTLVSPPFFRAPAVFAKQIATVDHISGGRVIAGLGAGWFKPEFENLGLPFPGTPARLRALEELIQILRSLFSEPRTTFAGEHFQLANCMLEPKPERMPPLLIGGGGERVTLRLAARYADIWNNMAVHQGELGHKVSVLKRRCDEEKRDFDTITVSQQCTVVIAPDEATARKHLAKAHQVYGAHMGSALEKHGIWGTPDRVVERIEAHRALGCTGFVIEFFGRDTRKPAQLFAETVLPQLA